MEPLPGLVCRADLIGSTARTPQNNGMITAKHGRTTEQLGAISGALTLLANIEAFQQLPVLLLKQSNR